MDSAPALRKLLQHALKARAHAVGFASADHQFSWASLIEPAPSGLVVNQVADRSIILITRSQAAAASALVALDGVAASLVICPPDFDLAHLAYVAKLAQADLILTDDPDLQSAGLETHFVCPPFGLELEPSAGRQSLTEWRLFTSGTTGTPKLAVHTLKGLTGAIPAANPASAADPPTVWGTFYDIRRYGGLQIFLRALCGGAALCVSEKDEPVGAYLTRLGAAGVTHLTGTPSHWRRALMSPHLEEIAPRYVRLSGEIADQGLLDRLAKTFPSAKLGHAYASTEAGVAFEVTDGLEGFPRALLDRTNGPVRLKIRDGALLIRSDRCALRYLGDDAKPVADADGYVDTDDLIEVRDDRCYFAGRRAGVINVGGAKVHPEEVEAVLNRHPDVELSRVFARQSPLTGALVAAEVVARAEGRVFQQMPELSADLRRMCREALGAVKTPATLGFVDSLPLSAAGKLDRRRA